MVERYTSLESGGRRWLWQRLAAASLVVVLAFHLFLFHFVNYADEVTFALSQVCMEQLTYFSLMILFLATATFHGVNGVYNVLVNQGPLGTRKTAAKVTPGLVNVLLIMQGVRTAPEWTGGAPI